MLESTERCVPGEVIERDHGQKKKTPARVEAETVQPEATVAVGQELAGKL